MLATRHIYPTIPAADIARAERWYEEKLGLTPVTRDETGLIYDLDGGSGFLLYPTPNAGKSPNTVATFNSNDVAIDVTELRARGVVFEEYDLPGLKTVDAIASFGNRKAAWFKDSEGNILAIGDST
jgi:catechol 2,3-dioxygenase-like lactoylglutathione lyase family enzyme